MRSKVRGFVGTFGLEGSSLGMQASSLGLARMGLTDSCKLQSAQMAGLWFKLWSTFFREKKKKKLKP
jgi:hypothetical protein